MTSIERNAFPLTVFLLAALLLGLLFVGVGSYVQYQSEQRAERSLDIHASALRLGFEGALLDAEQQMLSLATLIAEDDRVQSLFADGVSALIEGDTSLTDYYRTELLTLLEPRWNTMQERFGLRQLQFHLSPFATSYLRVHQPDHFGDQLEAIRPLVSSVQADHQPRTGFEIGRIYSGIRGVVPVYSPQSEMLGTLEAGTAFDDLLERLDRQWDAGFAVLLREEHIDNAVWIGQRHLSGPQLTSECGCYLEAFTRDQVFSWLEQSKLPRVEGAESRSILLADEAGKAWQVIRLGLRDYAGQLNPDKPNVGSIVIWIDRTEWLAEHQKNRLDRIYLLLAAFLMALALLYVVVLWGRQRLQRRIIQATQALKEKNELYRSVAKALSEGIVLQDKDGHILANNPAAETILGLNQEQLKKRTSADPEWQAIHEDGTPFPADQHPSMRCLRTGESIRQVVMGLALPMGERRWISINAEPLRSEPGAMPYAVVTSFTDITHQRAAEQALKVSEERYRTALESINDGLWEADLLTGQVHWDKRCYEIFGYKDQSFEVTVDAWFDSIHPDDRQRIEAVLEQHLQTGELYLIEYRARCANGHWLWVEGKGKVTEWYDDQPAKMIGTATDITRRKEAEEALQYLVVTDSLTGLSNRHYFFEQIHKTCARFKRHQDQPVCVMMLDIDYFKQINDCYGHAAGDQVLATFARLLRKNLRETDLAARVGGEEFALLLYDTTLAGATELAERIRVEVERTAFQYEDQMISVTVSIGLAEITLGQSCGEDDLRRADKALYQAKHQGRNCVVLAAAK